MFSGSNKKERVRAEKELISANNKLATQLYLDLATYHRFQNIIFSPLCLTLGMGRVAAVTQDSVKEEVARFLGIALDEHVLGLMREYSRSMRALPVKFFSKVFIDRNLWESESNQFRTRSNSDVGIENFQEEPEKCLKSINDWVNDQSDGEIADILPEGVVCSTSRCILTNGTACKTNWLKPFFEVQTKERNFEVAEGDVVGVEMMELSEEMMYGYSDRLEAEMVRMDLQVDNLSMVIILPENSIDDLENHLETMNIAEELENLAEASVKLRLPKFSEESTRNLKEFLQNPGRSSAEIRSSGNFSLLSRSAPYSETSIFQKVSILVDEGIQPEVLTDSATLKEKPIDVFCDHPFIYIILYKNFIFLMGKFYQPNVSLPSKNPRHTWKKAVRRVREENRKSRSQSSVKSDYY